MEFSVFHNNHRFHPNTFSDTSHIQQSPWSSPPVAPSSFSFWSPSHRRGVSWNTVDILVNMAGMVVMDMDWAVSATAVSASADTEWDTEVTVTVTALDITVWEAMDSTVLVATADMGSVDAEVSELDLLKPCSSMVFRDHKVQCNTDTQWFVLVLTYCDDWFVKI